MRHAFTGSELSRTVGCVRRRSTSTAARPLLHKPPSRLSASELIGDAVKMVRGARRHRGLPRLRQLAGSPS
jgi:hypothetical protein